MNLLDYVRMQGPIVDAYGAEAVGRFVRLRNAGRFDEAGMALRAGSIGREDEVRAIIQASVRAQYEQVFAAFPDGTYLTHGNVDTPALFADLLRPGVRHLDGEAVELDGITVGFVGGGLPRGSRRHLSEQTQEELTAKVARLPKVDVLCSHMPPAIDDLRYDLLAGRPEPGSPALLEYVERHQPDYHYFGHVHQPRAARARVGRTWIVNAGYFRGSERMLTHPAGA